MKTGEDMALDTETFDALIDMVRRFVSERLRPLEGEVEAADAIPDDVVREMREMGLFGLSVLPVAALAACGEDGGKPPVTVPPTPTPTSSSKG